MTKFLFDVRIRNVKCVMLEIIFKRCLTSVSFWTPGCRPVMAADNTVATLQKSYLLLSKYVTSGKLFSRVSLLSVALELDGLDATLTVYFTLKPFGRLIFSLK